MTNAKLTIFSITAMFLFLMGNISGFIPMVLISANLLFYLLFTLIKENKFSQAIGNLFFLSAILYAIGFVLPINIEFFSKIINTIATSLTLISLILLFISYLIIFVKEILEITRVEIKIKK